MKRARVGGEPTRARKATNVALPLTDSSTVSPPELLRWPERRRTVRIVDGGVEALTEANCLQLEAGRHLARYGERDAERDRAVRKARRILHAAAAEARLRGCDCAHRIEAADLKLQLAEDEDVAGDRFVVRAAVAIERTRRLLNGVCIALERLIRRLGAA
jgi:hypothetical protein